MRTFVLCLVFVTLNFSSSLFAQPQKELDSLTALLKVTRVDSSRMRVLDDLCSFSIRTGNLDEALNYNNELKLLAEKVIFENKDADYVTWWGKQVLANAYSNFGKIATNQGKLEEALAHFKKSTGIYEEIESNAGMANGYLDIGSTYGQQGNMTSAIEYLEKSRGYYEVLKDTSGMINVLGNMGSINMMQGNFPQSLEIFLKVLKFSEKVGNKLSVAHSYNNIGYMYDMQQNYDDALKNYTMAMQIFTEIGHKKGMAFSYNNIGVVHAAKTNYQEAIKCYDKSLAIAREIGDNYTIAQNLLNIGEAYLYEDKYELALENFLAAQKLFIESGDQMNTATTYLNIAKIYSKQNKYPQAEKNYKKCLDLAIQTETKPLITDSYAELASLYERTHDYKNAIQYLKLHRQLKDSMVNETSTRQINELKTKYETEKKDAKIALLHKEKEVTELEIRKQKTLKYSFAGGLALFGLVSLFAFKNARTKQKLKLQTLRNKISSDLHDEVGSTLSSIALFSDVAKEQSKEVMPMLQNISDSSRKMLESMADIVWTINPENDNFEKIILRMRNFAFELLGAKNIDFDFKVDDSVAQMNLSMEARKNLYLVFKEAINNLVKYSEANRASFSITSTKNNLVLLIRDNGKGFDPHQITEGNGLKNMRKRAEEIGGRFLIESEIGNGTTIQLILKAA